MMGGPGIASKPAAAGGSEEAVDNSNEALLNPPEPKIIVRRLLSKDELLIATGTYWNSYYEGGYGGEVILPGVDFNAVKKKAKDPKSWQHMFEKVALIFGNENQEISNGTVSTAQSKLETVKAVYENYGIRESEDEYHVGVRLKKCKENEGVYFEAMVARFAFIRLGIGVRLSLEMKFTRSGYFNGLKDKLASIFDIMPDALKHALHTSYLIMCHEKVFSARLAFRRQLNSQDLPADNNFSYRTKLTCSSIPTTLDKIYTFVASPQQYAMLHKKFAYISGDLISLKAPGGQLDCRHVADKEHHSIQLESAGKFASGKIQITLHLKNENGAVSASIEFKHNAFGALASGISDALKTMCTTMLRHLYQKYYIEAHSQVAPAAATPAPARAPEFAP